MKSAVEQLSTYKSVHLNQRNILTHFVGIPLIIWSAFLLLATIRITLGSAGDVSLGVILGAGVLVYYFRLHAKLAIGLALFVVPVVYTTELMADSPNAFWLAISVFIVGWIFQLIGHQYEKAKPAFVDDLNQLLIGPFFLMAEVYFILGFEKELDAEITPIAIEKRRALEARLKTQSVK
ncbi:Mpo1 family 2-hydroxy fatty acid dioxygenase [Shewanella mangrovisoli]|uniref:Mpo1 family 2-hydroxy fatty acid dioxygenase n=1 Tax=Shewanella mangrovisoli TaxID=2864211 RepID=UPI0035B768DF